MLGSHSPASSDKATVLVADATPMDCQLVSEAIQRHNHFRVIGRVVSSGDTISAVCRVQPDVALISARLQDGAFAGLLALRGLRALQARSRIVMVLDNDERELVVDAFLNKARGVFCRRLGSSGELRKCIRSVHSGEFWVNNAQLEYIVEALTRAPARTPTNGKATTVLSKREEEIAGLVATGMSNRDVADKLGLSPHTVKNFLFRIFEKLGISTRIELVLYVLSQDKPLEANSDVRLNFPDRESA
jgi:DNA-binding NarL/FixJ family response regulator